MPNGKPRAYTNAIVRMGSISRAVARFTCISCTHELELANNDPRKHAAFFAQQARKRGWDTDGAHPSRVFCPDCRKTPSNRSRRQVELDSVVLPALEPPIIEGVAEPVSPSPAQREWCEQAGKAIGDAIDDFIPRLSVDRSVEENLAEMAGNIETALDRMPPMPRELTNEQRRHIRTLLDQYFDDKEGYYLSGDGGEAMSDQAIGSLAGVPWGEVTKIRELSYGKIMVDPAIAALRAQFAELDGHIATQLADLQRRMNEMRAALDGYGRKQRVAS